MLVKVQPASPINGMEASVKGIEIDFDAAKKYSREEVRAIILSIESALLAFPGIEFPLKHHFSKDLYARELEIPKDALLVGKIHKHRCFNVVLKGEVSVLSEDGYRRLKGGETFVSEPGAKRVIFAHEPSTWMTVHGTPETNIEALERELTAESYQEFHAFRALNHGEKVCLSLLSE